MLEIGAELKIVSVSGARVSALTRATGGSLTAPSLASTGLSLTVSYRQLGQLIHLVLARLAFGRRKQWVLSRNSRFAWRADSVAPRCCSNPVYSDWKAR